MIDFEKLSRIYELIRRIDSENRVLRNVLREFSAENEFSGSDNVFELEKLAYSLALGGDKQLIDDFEYLLHETPMMENGGSITTADGKLYTIRTFEDLRRYWVETGVVGNE